MHEVFNGFMNVKDLIPRHEYEGTITDTTKEKTLHKRVETKIYYKVLSRVYIEVVPSKKIVYLYLKQGEQ